MINLVWWGSHENAGLIDAVKVRDTSNFNWTFIFILAVVFYVYWSTIHKKDWKALWAGLALYGVHWLYEIVNAIIGTASGYPLWTVSNDSTTFILLKGVSWELSMMFALAGIISWKMMPAEPGKRMFTFKGKWKGVDPKIFTTIAMAALFALFEAFLAGTSNGSFLWYYPWWGVLPVFITTYIPFFLAANYVPDMKPKARNIFLISVWGTVILLLAILIPCGVI